MGWQAVCEWALDYALSRPVETLQLADMAPALFAELAEDVDSDAIELVSAALVGLITGAKARLGYDVTEQECINELPEFLVLIACEQLDREGKVWLQCPNGIFGEGTTIRQRTVVPGSIGSGKPKGVRRGICYQHGPEGVSCRRPKRHPGAHRWWSSGQWMVGVPRPPSQSWPQRRERLRSGDGPSTRPAPHFTNEGVR